MVGRVRAACSKLRGQPTYPFDVGCDRGLLSRESLHEPIERRRAPPKIELMRFSSWLRRLPVQVLLPLDGLFGEGPGQPADRALSAHADEVLEELGVEGLRLERQRRGHGKLYVDYHDSTYNWPPADPSRGRRSGINWPPCATPVDRSPASFPSPSLCWLSCPSPPTAAGGAMGSAGAAAKGTWPARARPAWVAKPARGRAAPRRAAAPAGPATAARQGAAARAARADNRGQAAAAAGTPAWWRRASAGSAAWTPAMRRCRASPGRGPASSPTSRGPVSRSACRSPARTNRISSSRSSTARPRRS